MPKFEVEVVETHFIKMIYTVNAVSRKHAIKKAKAGEKVHEEFINNSGSIKPPIVINVRELGKPEQRPKES